MIGSNRQTIIKSTISVPCKTEEDIFVALGLTYKEPPARSFFLSPRAIKMSSSVLHGTDIVDFIIVCRFDPIIAGTRP